MSFSQRTGQLFDSLSKQRGRQYYEQRRVEATVRAPGHCEARVQGGAGEYGVRITWEPGEETQLSVSCQCGACSPRRPCKHLWAAFLELDRLGVGKATQARRPLTLTTLETSEATGAVPPQPAAESSVAGPADDRRSPSRTVMRPGAAAVASAPPARRMETVPSAPAVAGRRALPEFAHRWRHQFRRLHEVRAEAAKLDQRSGLQSLANRHEVWYVLDLAASSELRCAVIGMFERFHAPNGTWSPLRRLVVSSNSLTEVTDPEDRALVQLLLGPDTHALSNVFGPASDTMPSFLRWTPPRRSAGAVTPSLYDHVFSRLSATGRLVFANSVRHDQDFTRLPALHWQADQEWRYQVRLDTQRVHGVWRLVGELAQGSKTIALLGTHLLPDCGLAIVGNQLSRLETGALAPWATLLGDAHQMVVPFEDGAEFLGEIWSLPEGTRPALPPELAWEESGLEPAGRLSVHAVAAPRWKSRLAVQAKFVYGGSEIDLDDGRVAMVDVEAQRIHRRVPAKERELLDRIEELDILTPDPQQFESRRSQYSLESRRLEEFVERSTAAGWQVVADGHVLRRPGTMKMSVSTGVDWFDLEGIVDFDGVSVSLPSILAAVKKGEKYVRLGDGTYGMLPREWLERFGHFVTMGAREGEAIRFQLSQAMLLDAMLSSHESTLVECDARYDELRDRLRSTGRVQPGDAPPSFLGSLRPYQREGLGWLQSLNDLGCGGCLADDMGLGKTIQVLALLEGRRTRSVPEGGSRRPSLVVVPRSLVFNWLEEARRFTPDLRVLNYTGSERLAAREQLADYDVVVTTYGVLRRDIVDLKEIEFDYAILDEAQAIKNASSLSAKACRLIRADHRLAMTGTPIENHLGELWSLCEFLNPGMLGQSKTFQSLVKSGGKRAAAAPAPDQGAYALLARALRPFILRRTKKQVLSELPERTEQTLYCEMEDAQRKVYNELRDHYRLTLLHQVEETGLERSKIQILEALLRLRQVACHPALVAPDKAAAASAKLELLFDQLEELIEENHKVLVFSQFTSLLTIVRRELNDREISYEYLDGKTSNRQRCVERFQTDPECRLFLISLKAGGQGLNLTAADYVFILDPWWNPAVEAQAVDRAYRMGQTRHVFAYRLICRNTVEEKILELQKSKRELAESIIGEENAVLRNLTTEDLDLLLS